MPDPQRVTGDPAASDVPARRSSLGSLTRYPELVVVLLAALALRARGLGEWWLNPDEGIYYSIVTRARFSDFWADLMGNAHPPLYYLLLRAAAAFTWDFTAFRALTIVCGLAAIGFAWGLAHTLAGGGARGRVAGLVAAAVLAFSPAAVELSVVMRPYMLQIALLAGAATFLVRYLDSDHVRDLAVYALLLVLALLTHYSSILAGGVLGLVVLLDGASRGFARPAWRRLAGAHVLPAAVFLALYAFHLRHVTGSTMADDALGGWLSFYLIDSPGDAWLAFLGFQHLMGISWTRGATALLLFAAMATAFAVRDVRPAVLAAGGLLVALLAAAIDVYPFGSTRHSAWLLAYAVPVLGWLAAVGFERRSTTVGRAGIGVAVVILLLGGPIGAALGEPRAPWAPTDRVLRQEDLTTMIDVLDPEAAPDLVLMSAQTFYLLSPFYPREREAAAFSANDSLFHFGYGRRTVLVTQAWDLTLAGDRALPGHLATVLAHADTEFGDLHLDERAAVSILVGGWRAPIVDQLGAIGAQHRILRDLRTVPGFYAFEVDAQGLRRALGAND